MNARSIITLFTASMCLAILAPTMAQGQVLHGRVSFEAGGAMVKGLADADWSFASVNALILPGDTLWADEGATLEVELPGGNFIRMADGTRAEVSSVPPNTMIEGWVGAFYVQRTKRSSGRYVLRTPACDVEIDPDSHVRIDIVADGSSTVTVRWGKARVSTEGAAPIVVTSGRRVFCDVGFLASPPVPINRNALDDFDEWSRERAELLAVGVRSVPSKVYNDAVPTGAYELSSYGDWMTVEGRQCWRPSGVRDYVPYRQGSWSYVPMYGNVWVGHQPFSYVTSHYGRWDYNNSHGWLWSYTPGWGPAWVATARYNNNYIWSPLDYYGRPATYGSGHFRIGNTVFSLAASSYAYGDNLYYGPGYVRSANHSVIRGIHGGDAYFWDIYSSGYASHRGSHRGYGQPVHHGPANLWRNNTPGRIIRGLDYQPGSGVYASAIVDRLQQFADDRPFRRTERTGRRGLRTALRETSRQAHVQAPRLNSRVASLRELRSASRTSDGPSARGVSTIRSNAAGTSSSRRRAVATADDTRTTRSRSTVRSGAAPRPVGTSRSAAPTRTRGLRSTQVETNTTRPATNRSTSRPGTSRRAIPTGSSTGARERTPIPSRQTAPSRPGVSSRTPAPRGLTTIRSQQPRTINAPSSRTAIPSRASTPQRRTATPSRSFSTPSRSTSAPSRSFTSTPSRTPAPSRSRTSPSRNTSAPSRSFTSTPSRTPAPSRSRTSPSRNTSAPSRSFTSTPSRTPAPLRSRTAPSRNTSKPSRSVSTPSRSTSNSRPARASAPSQSTRSSAPSRSTSTRSSAPSRSTRSAGSGRSRGGRPR